MSAALAAGIGASSRVWVKGSRVVRYPQAGIDYITRLTALRTAAITLVLVSRSLTLIRTARSHRLGRRDRLTGRVC